MKTDLRKRLAAANELQMPDLLPEIRSRSDAGAAPWTEYRPQPRHRVASALVAAAVFAAAASFAWTALRPGRGASPGGGSGVHPPAWLVAQATVMALQNGDATPTSARWLRTDAKTAAPAVGLSPDQATGGVEFLVVLEGNFVGQLAKVPSGSQAPTGTRLAITLDPKTHQVLDYGVTNRSVELPGLLPFRLAPVPAPSSPRVCSLLTAAEVARALDTTVRNVSQLTKEDFMVPQPAGSAAGRYTTSRSTSLTLALSPISWEAYRRTYLSPGPSDVVEKVRGIGRGARFEGCNELSVFSGGHVLSLGLQRGACDAADELKSLARIALVRILDLNVPTSFTSSPQPP